MSEERPLEGLSDEQLKSLGQEMGVKVTLPSDVAPVEDALGLEVEETPPTPAFLVQPNHYGPGTVRVTFPDGTPVGVYVHEQMPAATAEEVYDILTDMGMESKYAVMFADHRRMRDASHEEAMSQPAVQQFAQVEAEREEHLSEVRRAFVEAQAKKKT